MAVWFDFDGVLVDSASVNREVWSIWSRRHGLDAETVFAATFGRRPHDTVAAVAPGLAVEDEVAELSRLLELHRDSLELQPGAAAAVQAARHYPTWGVVTSSSHAHVRHCLARLELPAPPTLITSDDVARGKPSPDPYLTAAEDARVPARDCLVIEDSPAGVSSARAAGSTVIAVATTHPEDELGDADHRTNSMTDVARLLRDRVASPGDG